MLKNNLPSAYFISPHGYGHAARASAVMEALHDIDDSHRFEIFTLVPEWFFKSSLDFPYGYHPCLSDVGMSQKNSLVEDIPSTLAALDDFLPIKDTVVERMAGTVLGLGCRIVLCDISPLGIAVARKAGIPSILIENFTWDWIYEAYSARDFRFQPHIDYLRDLFRSADYHIQTAPVCRIQQGAFGANPVGRRFRRPPDTIRRELGLPHKSRVVLITMGGIPWEYTFLDMLRKRDDLYFIVLGAVSKREIKDNLVLLPQRSGFYHPDLINAADTVIGKVGYSTVAEVFYSGIPMGHIPRNLFPESEVLISFIEQNMQGALIRPEEFEDSRWLSRLDKLLTLPRGCPTNIQGANQVALFLSEILGSE